MPYNNTNRSKFKYLFTESIRLNNAHDQFILKLIKLNKFIIHVNSGEVITRYMANGLACDYRIVADNTSFPNSSKTLSIPPKGGVSFLLSKMLGTASASKVLLTSNDISAEEAYQLKLVDKVVPLKDLETVAMETAQAYSSLPPGYTAAVKKLLYHDIDKFEELLEYESSLLLNGISTNRLDISESHMWQPISKL